MYDLPYHKETNKQAVSEFIAKYPFAFLAGCDLEGRPVATQVPVFMEEQDGQLVLSGHLMKDTDHYRVFLQNENVLVVFSGKHAYVSGAWYSNPSTPSTWNYMSVHVKGTIQLLEGEAVEEVLRKTSLYFENGNRESPTIFDNLPAELRENAVKAIAAFKIEVAEVDTVFKLSQDRDAASFSNIVEKLKTQTEDSRVIASEMEKRFSELFPEN